MIATKFLLSFSSSLSWWQLGNGSGVARPPGGDGNVEDLLRLEVQLDGELAGDGALHRTLRPRSSWRFVPPHLAGKN